MSSGRTLGGMAATAGAGGGADDDANGLLKLPKPLKFVELQPASTNNPVESRTADDAKRHKRAICTDSSQLSRSLCVRFEASARALHQKLYAAGGFAAPHRLTIGPTLARSDIMVLTVALQLP